MSALLGAGTAEAFALTTDQSAYVATCADDSFLNCAFTLNATTATTPTGLSTFTAAARTARSLPTA